MKRMTDVILQSDDANHDRIPCDDGCVKYSDPLGSVTLGGNSRRRRVDHTGGHNAEQSGYATFVLEDADLTDRPFMEVAWLEPDADCNTQISMSDSAGNSFL